jgi:hypothetical protein
LVALEGAMEVRLVLLMAQLALQVVMEARRLILQLIFQLSIALVVEALQSTADSEDWAARTVGEMELAMTVNMEETLLLLEAAAVGAGKREIHKRDVGAMGLEEQLFSISPLHL